jgi:hypothetical protein
MAKGGSGPARRSGPPASPTIHPFEITHIQGLASFAVGENAPKGCYRTV